MIITIVKELRKAFADSMGEVVVYRKDKKAK